MDLKKLVVPAIVVALLVAAAFTFLGGEERKTLTAHFPRTDLDLRGQRRPGPRRAGRRRSTP